MMKKHDRLASVLFIVGVIFAFGVAGGETEPPVPARKPAAYRRTDEIIYGRKYGMALTMDLLRPANPNGAAVLWVISSGFFSSHEETLDAGFARALSRCWMGLHGVSSRARFRTAVRIAGDQQGYSPSRALCALPRRRLRHRPPAHRHIRQFRGRLSGHLAGHDWLRRRCRRDGSGGTRVSRVQAVACFFQAMIG